MISIYTSGFKLIQNEFDLDLSFSNWFDVADEVVIATVSQQENGDNTLEYLEEKKKQYGEKLKVIVTDFLLSEPLTDGKLKNASLQACSNENVILLDLDELLAGDKENWNLIFEELDKEEKYFGVRAYMVPVLNLYKNIDSYSNVAAKWYTHKKQGTYRGVVNFARKSDGHIDTNRSDTTELISQEGNIIKWSALYKNFYNDGEYFSLFKQGAPFIIHWGYLNIERRLTKINKFWGPVWSARKGSEVKVPLVEEELTIECKKHGLDLKKYFVKN